MYCGIDVGCLIFEDVFSGEKKIHIRDAIYFYLHRNFIKRAICIFRKALESSPCAVYTENGFKNLSFSHIFHIATVVIFCNWVKIRYLYLILHDNAILEMESISLYFQLPRLHICRRIYLQQ
jgi:hypothetical protein